MKKESNRKPKGVFRPDPPSAPPTKELKMNITSKRMADIFNEWAKRYSEKPDEFTSILDDNGKPVKDYGESCTRYFTKLNDEMNER